MQGEQLPPTVAPDDETGGRHLALRVAFTLPASCYATMLIRELTKQPNRLSANQHSASPNSSEPAVADVVAGAKLVPVAAADDAVAPVLQSGSVEPST
jgi:hypothetical protein